MKIKKRTCYVITDDHGREFEVSQEPSEHVTPIIRNLPGDRIAIGYLAHDQDCPHPLDDCDGMGHVYDQRRNGGRQGKQFMAALGIDRDGEPEGTADPYAVLLDVYEHSGTAWSLSGEGMNDKWDTSRAAGVWVPDDCCREHINETAKSTGRPAREIAIECARQALEPFNSWLAGDCYGVCVEVFDVDGTRDASDLDDSAVWGHVGAEWAEQDLKQTMEAL